MRSPSSSAASFCTRNAGCFLVMVNKYATETSRNHCFPYSQNTVNKTRVLGFLDWVCKLALPPVPLPTTILALLEESVLALLLPFSRNPPAAFYQRPCISHHPLPTLESESPFQVLTNLVTFQFWHGFWLSRFGAQFSKTE